MTRNGSSRAAKWTCVSPCLEVALTLVEKAGDFINDKLWHRIVQAGAYTRPLSSSTSALLRDKLGGVCDKSVSTSAEKWTSVVSVTKAAQVELKCGRVQATACRW